MHGLELFPYLELIRLDNIDRQSLREFIEICTGISLKYLNKRHYKLKTIFSVNNILFEDIAVDAVAPLFIKYNSLNITGMQKSLTDWDKKLDSESGASFFLHKLIWNRTDQTVVKLLGEIDPVYKKLLKNLIYNAKNTGYKKISYMGELYLIEDSKTEINGTLISESDFNNIPSAFLNGKLNSVIHNIIEYIKKETKSFPAIPLNLLVKRLKRLYLERIDNPDSFTVNFEISFDLNNILKSSLQNVLNKLNNDYVAKEKLTVSEGESFKLAIKDIVLDLKDGGMNRGMEEYLKPYFINVSVSDLKTRYHNLFAYLVKLLKKDIADRLEKNEFS